MTRRETPRGGRPFVAGDIVGAPFPTYDLALGGAVKQRPAVVVCSATFTEWDADLILCPVTTKRHSPLDVAFDWVSSGLPAESYVRPKPSCVPRAYVTRRGGRLPAADWGRLQAALRTGLDLSPQQDPE